MSWSAKLLEDAFLLFDRGIPLAPHPRTPLTMSGLVRALFVKKQFIKGVSAIPHNAILPHSLTDLSL